MECNICKSTINSNQLIKLNDCTHEFCQQQEQYNRECLYKYLKNKIDQKKFQFITCPSCSIELSINVIKQYCPTHFDKYQALKENLFVRCYICQEDVQIHVCQEDVCKQCGQEHQENCNIWICPKCYQPVRKNNQNHIVCNCQYEFCWICFSKMTKYHYSFWNLCGCPIPESKKLDINPLRYRTLFFILMLLPKIIFIPIYLVYKGFELIVEFEIYMIILLPFYVNSGLNNQLICKGYQWFVENEIYMIILLPFQVNLGSNNQLIYKGYQWFVENEIYKIILFPFQLIWWKVILIFLILFAIIQLTFVFALMFCFSPLIMSYVVCRNQLEKWLDLCPFILIPCFVSFLCLIVLPLFAPFAILVFFCKKENLNYVKRYFIEDSTYVICQYLEKLLDKLFSC